MNYEEMSKPELCALVAKAWFDDVIQHGSNCDGSIYLDRASEEYLVEFDPIDNPSDAWPIIVENKISIKHDIARYSADSLVYSKQFDDGFKIFRHEGKIGDTSSMAALRAAMICFLKMKDAEK